MRRSFVVVLDIPPGANQSMAIDYIDEALSTYRGSLRYPGALDDDDPGDPMWHLNTDTIKVMPSKEIA